MTLVDDMILSKESIDYSTKEISTILDSFINWWDKDKVLLERYANDESIYKEIVLRFLNIPRLLAYFVIPIMKKDKDFNGKIKYLINEFSLNKLPCLKVIASLQASPLSSDFQRRIRQAIGSSEKWTYDDAYEAVLLLCSNKSLF
jgi:hypothetical protein